MTFTGFAVLNGGSGAKPDILNGSPNNDLFQLAGPGVVTLGGVSLQGNALVAGDGAAITDEDAVAVQATAPSEVLLFDLV